MMWLKQNVQLIIFLMISMIITSSCNNKDKWKLEYTIVLKEITPNALAANDEGIWISDKASDTVYLIDTAGNILESFEDIDQPGFISADEGSVYIPESASDQFIQVWNNQAGVMIIDEHIQRPSSISVNGEGIAITDPLSQRVVYFDGLGWQDLIAKEENGYVLSPLNVEISDNNILVTSEQNNQIQLFNRSGEWHSYIQLSNGFSPSGLCINGKEIIVCDSDKNLVQILDLNGKLLQELSDHLYQPSDVAIFKDMLIISNLGTKEILVYSK